MPKRCGHLEGKVLLDFEEAVVKIEAAADARDDKDFVINARTDALGVYGIEEAIRRGNAFLEVGATMVFLEGANSIENIKLAVDGIKGPVAINLVEGGKSPKSLSFTLLEEMGVARVSLPSTAMQATIRALENVFQQVRKNDGIQGYEDLLCGFGVSQNMLGRDKIFELEKKYMSSIAEEDSGRE